MPFALVLMVVSLFLVLVYRIFQEMTVRQRVEDLSKLLGVELIELSRNLVFGLGIRRVSIRIPGQVYEKVVEKIVEVPTPLDPREEKLKERLQFEIASWPKSLFEMPRYVELTFLGKSGVFELVPVIAHHSGVWHFAKQEHSPSKDSLNRRPERKPWRFWSCVTPSDLLGVVVERHHGVFRKKHSHYAPKVGNVCTFQILDGANVDKGDLLLILAVEVENFPEGKEKPA